MRRYVLVWLGLAVLLFTGAVVAWSWWSRPVQLSVALGGNEGDLARLMTAFARDFAHTRPGVALRIVNYPDPLAAADAFRQGKTDLGLLRADMPLRNATALAVLRKNVVVLLSGEGAKLSALVRDRNLRLALVGQNGVNDALVQALAKAYALEPKSVSAQSMTVEAAVEALAAHRVDAILGAAPLQGTRYWEALRSALREKKAKVSFVEIDRSPVIANTEPAYEEFEIPEGGLIANPALPPEAVQTISVATYLVARPGLPDRVAALLAREIVSDKQDVAGDVPSAVSIEAPSTDKDALLRVHPGAAAYFDGEEETFFEKYGDMIYYGGAALGILGSAILALSRRFGPGRDHEAAELVTRLLDLRRRAKRLGEAPQEVAADGASPVEIWTGLAGEYEEMLSHALPLMTRGGIEDRTVQALSLALRTAERAVDEAALKALRKG